MSPKPQLDATQLGEIIRDIGDAREQQARAGAVDKLRGEVEMDEWRKSRESET